MDHTSIASYDANDLRERAQLMHFITQAQAALGDDYRPNKAIAPVLCLLACATVLALFLLWLLLR